jgi:hypothetical protein
LRKAKCFDLLIGTEVAVIKVAALMAENSPYNWIEAGSGVIGLIGCGVDYAYILERGGEYRANLE